jgi:DNA polymerase III alpha subunit
MAAIDHDVLAKTARSTACRRLPSRITAIFSARSAFYDAATKAGVKPIIGCEMYVAKTISKIAIPQRAAAPSDRSLRKRDGYQNLVKLVSKATWRLLLQASRR